MEHQGHQQQTKGRLSSSEIFAYEIVAHKGKNLPKADTIGSIDAYLIIVPPEPHPRLKTKTINNSYNPKWKEALRWQGGGIESESITVQVWDSDTASKDDYIGCFRFDATELPFKKRRFTINLEHEFENKVKDKKKPSEIILSFGVVPSYNSTKQRMLARGASTTDVIFNDKHETIYMNLQYWGLPYYVAVEWETKDDGKRLDMFLLQTAPEDDLAHIEKNSARWGLRSYPGTFHFKLKKNKGELRDGVHLKDLYTVKDNQGQAKFQVYEELKLDDLPLYAPLYDLEIQYGKKVNEWHGTVDSVVTKHGWRGIITYGEAKKTLTNAHFDDKHKQIYFAETQGLFKVDYDSDNMDYQFYLYKDQANSGHWMELGKRGETKRTLCYMEKTKKLFDKEVVMYACIDDIKYGVTFDQIIGDAFKLEGPQSLNFATLFPLNPFGNA